MGRPCTFTAELAAQICEEVASGETLRAVCRKLDLRHPTVLNWVIYDHEGFADQYARARQAQFDSWSDEILQHADSPLIGEKTKETEDGGIETTTGDNVERAKLMVDSRKWLLSKLASKRFGDRTQTEITGADGGPLIVQWAGQPPKV